ncbi:hypothetical protein B5P41_31585, partial [Bacillus sp. SRB_28]
QICTKKRTLLIDKDGTETQYKRRLTNSERQCKEVADNETARKTASKQTPTSQMSHYELTKLIGNILEPDNKEDNIAD